MLCGALPLRILLGVHLFLACSHSIAQDDPLVLQQLAIRRIDGFVEGYRKTGDIQSRLGELAQADRELSISNQMMQSRRAWAPLALGFIKQGNIHRMQNNYPQARNLYRQAIEAARRAGNVAYESEALAWGAQVENSTRNLGQALADGAQAVRLAETVNDNAVLARALDILGSAQIEQGDLAAAAATINREVAVASASKDPMIAYFALLNRQGLLMKTAEKCDFQLVFEPCYQALNLAKADLQRMTSITSKLGFDALTRQNEDFMTGVRNREALIQARERSNQTIRQTNMFRPKKASDVLVTEQFVDLPGAEPAIVTEWRQESRRVVLQFPGYAETAEARSQYLEGLTNQLRGNNDAALNHYLKAVDWLERDRRALRDDRSRGSVLEDRIGFYYSPILQLLERRRHAEAFAMLERSRSRSLAEILASRNLGLSRPREQQLYSEVVTLRTRIASSQSQLFELISAPDSGKNAERIKGLHAQIQSFEANHQKLVARINAEAPQLRELVVSEPAGLDALQRSMRQEGFEMLQYLVLEPGIIVWHIAPDSVTVRRVFLPRGELTAKVAALRKSLERPPDSFDETSARELFLFLVQPLLGHVRSERLVIVPHEELGSIPFQTLQDPSNGQFLGERFQISYAPSATVLLALKRSSAIRGGRLLGVADPGITQAGREVLAIAKLFPDRSKTVVDELAKEGDVKAWIGESDVIHLSVHGKFEAADPLLSYLQLSRSAGEDGKLTAAEMFGLPLDRSRLVVLSACETGRAEITHSNEILGMIRALLYAGASRLVLSYWKVDSAATALWMQTFYEAAQTMPLPQAARAALIRVKGTPGYSHPYFWSAFMMIGR